MVVLAPSAGASRGVLREEAGFKDADTVAMFLKSEAMQEHAAGQVIWVDEASLLGNKDMAALFDIAERVNARVILMGDRRQHGVCRLRLAAQAAGRTGRRAFGGGHRNHAAGRRLQKGGAVAV